MVNTSSAAGDAAASPSAGAEAGTGRRRSSTPVRGLLPLLLLLAVWQVLADPRSPRFPPPSTWAAALVDLWGSGVLVPAVLETVRTLAVGLLAATLLGVVFGVLVGFSRRADEALGPTFEFARAMPPAAMVPVATLFLGFDETMKVAVVTIAAIWPVLLNVRAGVLGLDPTLLDTAKTLHLGRADRLRKVTIPALLPSIFAGVRVAAPIAVVITLLVEILTQVNGVGALIARAQQTFRPARAYGLIVVAGLISLLVNALLGALRAYLFRRRP